MRVEQIRQGDALLAARLPSATLQPGDRLIVRDTPDNLKYFERSIGATLHDVTDGVEAVDAQILPILSGFILIMAILTNLVSNNAAAVIGTPIAIAAAQQLGSEPLPFVLAVLLGANLSFATPFGYQTNLLILSTGGYRWA